MEADQSKNGKHAESFAEKRRETRFPVSKKGTNYIEMKVKSGNEYVPVVIDNLSKHGIQFESPVPFCSETQAECLVSISQSLSKDLAFVIQIKHCEEEESGFVCGANVESVADAMWFDIFIEVNNYISQRKGSMF